MRPAHRGDGDGIGNRTQLRLDIFELDAVAPLFQLIIDPPEMMVAAVGIAQGNVAGAILSPIGVSWEALTGEFVSIQITVAELRAAEQQLAGLSVVEKSSILSQDRRFSRAVGSTDRHYFPADAHRNFLC